jgi:sulfate transport system permease protein
MAMMPAAPAAGAYRPPLPWMRWGLRTVALLYLGVMLVIPLVVVARAGLAEGLGELWRAIVQPVAWHALALTLWTAATAALINAAMGTLTAYVLVRSRFPG